jgi:predicted DCC family thiol-disulfide oxidoreductase YuxK
VLIYDGDCAFCTAAAQRIAAHWIAGHGCDGSQIQAWQSLGPQGLARLGLTVADAQQAAWWVDATGRYRGHLAVAHALMHAGGWRRTVGRLITLPGISSLAAMGYWLVARYRRYLPAPPTRRS